MEQNLMPFIVGAGISLVTTVVTALITYIFQSITETKKRNWQIEDNKKNELLTLRKKRLGNVEELLDKLAKVASTYADMEEELISNANELASGDLAILLDFVQDNTDTNYNNADFKKFARNIKLSTKKLKTQHTTLMKFVADRGKKIYAELIYIIDNIHDLFAVNTEVFARTDEYASLVVSETHNFVRLVREIIKRRKINVSQESIRITKFRLVSAQLHGEILYLVDATVFD